MFRNVHIFIEGILILLMFTALFFSLARKRVNFVAVRNYQSLQRDYLNLPGVRIYQTDLTNYPAIVVSFRPQLIGLPVLMLLLTLFAMNRKRINKLGQPKIGCCLRCGYDLRASPDRCPECGLERDVEGTRPG